VPFKPEIMFTNFSCTFSRVLMSVCVQGDQAGVQNSRWGLTYVL
jgi:hypothetical protein